MLGIGIVTIGDNQWNVEVASSTTELVEGLAGRASIPAGTGMLFILPEEQTVSVTTQDMLFPIDIIFINNGLVIDVISGVQPGYLVEEETSCDMFLEVNEDEADLVEVGDSVTVEMITTTTPGFDINSIIAFVAPLAILGFLTGLMFSDKESPSSKKKQLSSGNPNEAYPVHCVSCGWTGYRTHGPLKPCPTCGGVVVWTFTGKTKPVSSGNPGKVTLNIVRVHETGEYKVEWVENGKYIEAKSYYTNDLEDAKATFIDTISRAQRSGYDVRVAGDRFIPDIFKDLEEREHHSIHGKAREELVNQYGSWAVGRAEAVCPENDVTCVTGESKRLYDTIQSRYGGKEVEYVTILTPGQTIFHSGDVVSVVALARENKRAGEAKEKEATWQ